MMAVIIIIPILFFAIIGGIAYFFIRKATPQNSIKETNVKTIQEFLPIKNIEDGYLVMKDDKLRRVIKCSSTNYYLKTEDEQTTIEMIFQQFINSLSFPISFFIQTRVIDNTKRMKVLRKDVENIKAKFPTLENYAQKYVNSMENINDIIGNSLEKNKYIIVPYDDEVTLNTATEDEKNEYIKKELDNRCLIIMNGLLRLGVKSHILNNDELIELLYSTFHRDDYLYSENLNKDESLCSIVEGYEDLFKNSDFNKNMRVELTSILNYFEANSNILTEEDRNNEQLIRRLYNKYSKKGEA